MVHRKNWQDVRLGLLVVLSCLQPAVVSVEEVQHHEEVFEDSGCSNADDLDLHHVFFTINRTSKLFLLQYSCQVLLSQRKKAMEMICEK